MIKRILYRPFFIKLFNWEYWPFHVVYGPVYLYWFWLCLKSRSFFFFNTSNPTIKNGGFLMESKWAIYQLLPKKYYPGTLFFRAGIQPRSVIDIVYRNHFGYPLVGKPDIGMQGIAVKKLDNEAELVDYIINTKVNFLVQEFVPWPNEVGIFYYRYPQEEKGHLSGIVSKEFLTVKGDGVSTIKELLQQDKRYVLQLAVLEKTYGGRLNKILPAGEEFVLVPYGNHVRGAKFIDASHLIDEKLTASIDAVCKKVEGFYFGRMDIRYNTWEELREGKNFSIIELNGAGSEPTHMYDPKHSIFFAWKEITRHWNILWKISRFNHRNQQHPYMDTRSGLSMLKENKEYVKMIADNSRKRA
ncbi:MAG: D-alanine--D-alanine ligase [Bacteroidota bacterium]|nr:D-alanine--D-alanine ligase [Bacteroidota bacterium]